jgi:hypothetical protein
MDVASIHFVNYINLVCQLILFLDIMSNVIILQQMFLKCFSEKIQYFSGSASDHVTSGNFMSPNFPGGYARQGEKYLYYIHNTDEDGTIQINFVDWDIEQNTRILVETSYLS